MKSTTRFISLALFAAVVAGCGSGNDLSRASTQASFGVQMAKMNLWQEAMFRFQRAVQLDPRDAMAHNNLAVALEANGDFEGAAREYREALRLDRSNSYIQKNYSRYTEFMSRTKKRTAKTASAEDAAPAAGETASKTPATTSETPAPAEAPAPPETPASPQPAPPPPAQPGGSL